MVIHISNSPRYRRYLRNLVGVSILSLILALVVYEGYSEGFSRFPMVLLWSIVICGSQWIGHSYLHSWLDRKYSWQEHLAKRAIYGSISIIVYSVIAFIVFNSLMFRLVNGRLPAEPVLWALKSSYFAIIVSFAVSIIFVAVGFFLSWKKSLLETERFKAEMLMYKYESLQNQINPHFLFNSFNVLSDLVYEDQTKAVEFIKQMSQLFRYVLDSRDRELVPISEEIEFLTSFAYLLQTRFEDKLSISIDVEAGPDEMIVPMSLQLLIENCVKHNEISTSLPLKISVTRNKNSIMVVNNLQLKNDDANSTRTGLSNIKQQYSYFTDRQIVIINSEDSYSVELPVIKADV